MKIAVLGAGPAGLMAAEAAAHLGHQVRVFSRKTKSHLNGAQYLHQPIPTCPTPDSVEVAYVLRGTALEYRTKVYGPRWDGTVSAEDLDENHSAWDIRATYDFLWNNWRSEIEDFELVPSSIPTLLASGAETIVSSIPAPALCTRDHTFGSVQAWAAGEAPGLGISLPYDCPENTVVCNGEPDTSWYRLSNIFGYKTIEWPDALRSAPPVKTVAQISKPTFNNCDCWPDVVRVGRYGRWEKGVLSHDAYTDTNSALLDRTERLW